MSGEQIGEVSREQIYDQMSGLEIVRGYLADEIESQVVMRRLLNELELKDVANSTLPITIDGKELKIEDYIEVAKVKGHAQAIPSILKFVALEEKDENLREAMKQTISAYLSHQR